MSDDSGHELVLPPISDDDNICLPLSVNAVAKYWNIDLPIAEANEIASKYVGMNGSILIEGINLAERHGLSSLILHSSITELKQVIDMGIPPIVILPGLHDVVQHASVISGYDDNEKTIFHYHHILKLLMHVVPHHATQVKLQLEEFPYQLPVLIL